ncbi:MAG: mechanosensitive ion channel domain-containing protein [Crocinitomicaceae bacterium]
MKFFDFPYSRELILTAIALIVFLLVKQIGSAIIRQRIKALGFSKARRKMVEKSVNFILVIVFVGVSASIWSVKQSDIILFVSSILTVLGVAFVAQWSHVSNITSGLIMFFSSSIRIGDKIKILDKDFDLSGTVVDIEAMFLKLKTFDGAIISIPNNVMLQKPVQYLPADADQEINPEETASSSEDEFRD